MSEQKPERRRAQGVLPLQWRSPVLRKTYVL